MAREERRRGMGAGGRGLLVRMALAGAAIALLAAALGTGCGCGPDAGPGPSGDRASAPEGPAASSGGGAPESAPGKAAVELARATDFESLVLESEVPVLVDLYARWCRPCRIQAPIVERIAARARGAYKVVKVDVDRFGSIARKYAVRSIPTLIVFAGGKPRTRFTGLHDFETLRQALAAARDG